MIDPRPKTLAEVAARTLRGEVFRMELADFLDEFYLQPNLMAIEQAPPRMNGLVENGHRRDVYLAAVAEQLGRDYRIPVGKWAFDEELRLKEPHFVYQSRAGRIFLLADSPAAFKSRNLFVTSNVLSRC